MILLSQRVRNHGGHLMAKMISNITSKYQLAQRNIFMFSSSNMVKDMNEVKQGEKFFSDKNMAGAEQMFQRAFGILPLFQTSNDQYNRQVDLLIGRLMSVYAWRGNISKIVDFSKRIEKERKDVVISQNVKKIGEVMAIINQASQIKLSSNKAIISKMYEKTLSIAKQGEFKIQQELTVQSQKDKTKSNVLQSWMDGQVRDTWTFIILSLVTNPTITSEADYPTLCNNLLKNTQKSSSSNIIKPLSLMISNLIRSQQYLQAEGMLSYCIDRKKQNIKSDLLAHNQQHILLNLLLAKTYSKVQRITESQQLYQSNRHLFDFQKLILQGYLIDSL